MAINKKLIFWNNQSNFSPPTSSTDTTKSVLWQSIVFFKDTKKIWTHGVYFSSPLDTLLSGYSVGTDTALAASDTILGAFGKIQAQLNATQVSLPDIPDLAGTYTKVTVSAKGLVTAGSNPTTLAGYGITDAYTKTQINDFLYTDTRTITPTTWGAGSMQFGFTSMNLANGSPYADFMRFGGYQDSTGGRENIILFAKGDFGMRQYQGSFNASTYDFGYVDYWHNGHFSSTNITNWNTAYSYSQIGHLPLSGGTLTGQLTMSGARIKMGGDVIEMGSGSGMLGAPWDPTVLYWYNGTGWQPVLHAGNYHNYALPLSGGTITSTSWLSLSLDTAASSSYFGLKVQGTVRGYLGYYSSDGIFIVNAASPNGMLGVLNDTTPYYSPNNGTTKHTLIHSGNIGSQNVANADTLDSYHASYFEPANNTIFKYRGGPSTLDYSTSNGYYDIFAVPSPSESYGVLINFDAYYKLQFYSAYNASNLHFRTYVPGSGWEGWRKVWTDLNLTNTLTNGYLPYWNGSSLVNSGLKQNSNEIILSGNFGSGGILKLIDSSIEASIGYKINGSTGNTGWVTGNFNDSFFIWSYTKGAQVFNAQPNGNIGIGYTDRTEKLAVNGSGYFNGELTLSGAVTSKSADSHFRTGHYYAVSDPSISVGNIGSPTTGNNDLYIIATNKLRLFSNGIGLLYDSGALSGATTITASSTISALGGNSSQWNTAYGWGNHAGLYAARNNATISSAGPTPLTLYTGAASVDNFINFTNDGQSVKFGVRNPYSSYGLTLVTPTNDYYRIIHEGNIGSQSVNYAASAGNADTLDTYHATSFLRKNEVYYMDKYVLESIPKNTTQVGSFGWVDYTTTPYAGGGFLTLNMASSLRSLLMIFPDYSNNANIKVLTSIDGAPWGQQKEIAWKDHTHDDRYYTEAESDLRYAYKAGNTSQPFSVSTLTFSNTITGTLTSTTSPLIRLKYNADSVYGEHLMDGNGQYVIKSPLANGSTSGYLVLYAGGKIRQYVNDGTLALTLETTGAATFSSSVSADSFTTANTSTAGIFRSVHSFWGGVFKGSTGSYSDFAILTPSDSYIAYVPVGTRSLEVYGYVNAVGGLSSNGQAVIHSGNIGSQSVNYATSAGSANSVANSLILKFDTGIVQGTDLYTFNGSAAKTIDFKAGSNVTLTKSSGSVTISALDYMVGRNTVTTLTSLPINKRSVLANVTAATSLSLASTLPEGQILTIKVYNTSGLSITQPLPTESPFESKKIDGSNLSSIAIAVGGSVEISIWSINNKYIIKTDG